MSATPSIVKFPTPAALIDGSTPALAPLSELATANRQRDALYRLSEQLARATSAQAIYSAALEAIETALDCDRSSILLFDDAGTMQFVAWQGLSTGYRAAVTGHSPWKAGEMDAAPIAMPDIALAELDPALKQTILDEAIEAVAFIPLVVDRMLIGKFMAYFREPRTLAQEDLNVALTIARQLGFAIQRQRTDAELAAELAVTRSLQSLSLEIARVADLNGLYAKLADTAQLIMRADFASMQEFYPHRGVKGELRLLTSIGFSPVATRFWHWVNADSGCTCGMAYRTLTRFIAADVELCDPPMRADDLAAYREAGIKAAQSTPLISRSGQLVGMISTHWKVAHAPSERDLRLFDILARLAADLIERKKTDEDLARREERSRTLTQLLTDVPWQARADGAFEELQPAWENFTGQTWDAHAGHGWFEAIHPDDRDAMRTSWASACFESQPYEQRARLWHAPSKQFRQCLIRATPIRNEDGSLREWVGACLDVQGRASQ
jgi:PAS domain S-box-containing protein